MDRPQSKRNSGGLRAKTAHINKVCGGEKALDADYRVVLHSAAARMIGKTFLASDFQVWNRVLSVGARVRYDRARAILCALGKVSSGLHGS